MEQEGDKQSINNIKPVELSSVEPQLDDKQWEPKVRLTEEIKQSDEYFETLSDQNDSPARNRLLPDRGNIKVSIKLKSMEANANYADLLRETEAEYEEGEKKNREEDDEHHESSREFEDNQVDIENSIEDSYDEGLEEAENDENAEWRVLIQMQSEEKRKHRFISINVRKLLL